MTGMRRSEIVKLRWEDVSLKDGYIQVVETKNNDSRVIPISGILLETLKDLKKKSKSEYVFTTHEGKPYTYVDSLKRAWYATLRRSGIAKCRFHDLRHPFATRLVMAGVDIVTVQELLGHKDIKMTKRYSHPTPEHKKQAIECINLVGMDTYLDTKRDDQPVVSVVSP
jgi:integrase